MKRLLLILVLLGGVLALTACTEEQAGDLQTVSHTINPEGAEAAEVEIRMGAGNLVVTGGAAGLAEADFTFNVAAWEPEVDYEVSGQQGTLVIRQPVDISLDPDLGDTRYDWSVRLGNTVPTVLDLEIGAGSANLNLNDVLLSRLEVSVGAGQVNLDLSGGYNYDLAWIITGGVGDVNISLPADMGVRVTVEGGLGNVIATGLQRQNGDFVNQAYGTAEHSLDLEIIGGVGEVELSVVE